MLGFFSEEISIMSPDSEPRAIAVYPVETEPAVEKYIREHGAELHEFALKVRELSPSQGSVRVRAFARMADS